MHQPPTAVSDVGSTPARLLRDDPPRGLVVIVHEYVGLDMDRVIAAIRHLDPVERFAEIVRDILRESEA